MSADIHSLGYTQIFDQVVKPLQITVPESSKVLIFSDTHFTRVFDQPRFDHLAALISESDHVIINGDFWYDSRCAFDEFMQSPWQALFPLLKSKGSIYLFGNHDMPMQSDERIGLFSAQAGFRLKLQAGSLRIHLEHGHLLSGRMSRMVLQMFERHPRLLHILTYPIGLGIRLLKGLFAQNSLFAQRINRQYKQKRLTVSDSSEYFIMGHTHVAEDDRANRYINLGRMHGGEFSYATIEANQIHLHGDK